MTKDSVSSDPDQLALGAMMLILPPSCLVWHVRVGHARLPPARMIFGNIPDQKQKYNS